MPELQNSNSEQADLAAEDMELETLEHAQDPRGNDDGAGSVANGAEPPANGEANPKRLREEEDDDVLKKQKFEKSVEEDRLEKLGGGEEEGEGDGSGPVKSDPVKLGPKEFGSSVEMFDYFFKLLHFWPTNVNINKVNPLVFFLVTFFFPFFGC